MAHNKCLQPVVKCCTFRRPLNLYVPERPFFQVGNYRFGSELVSRMGSSRPETAGRYPIQIAVIQAKL